MTLNTNEQPSTLVEQPSSTNDGMSQINSILEDLHTTSEDILYSTVVTTDGLTIMTRGTDYDDNQMGAMCSELLSVCERSARNLEQGTINDMFLRCSEGTILLVPSGTMIVLALITRPHINLGLLFIEAERAAKAIADCM